jgi:YD repeat-containing protein
LACRQERDRTEAEETREYLWNRNGRLAVAKNEAMMWQWFYDLAGNMAAEHQHDRKRRLVSVWRHGYDPLGWRINPFANSSTTTVMKSHLKWPGGWEAVKGTIGQEIFIR